MASIEDDLTLTVDGETVTLAAAEQRCRDLLHRHISWMNAIAEAKKSAAIGTVTLNCAAREARVSVRTIRRAVDQGHMAIVDDGRVDRFDFDVWRLLTNRPVIEER